MKNRSPLVVAVLLAIGVAGAVHAVENVTTEPLASAGEALARITQGGYFAPYDLEFRHGLWTADATTADGRRVDVVVDAVTGQIWTGTGASAGANFLDASQVRERLTTAGYTAIDDVEFEDVVWEAEARNRQGQRVDLVIHPVTGLVLAETIDGAANTSPGTANLSADQIREALGAAGYTQIRDLELDDGYWEAEARNASSRWVDLRIDPRSGVVIREEID